MSRSTTRSETPPTGSPAESRRHLSGSIDRVGGDHGHLAGPVGGEPADTGARRHPLGHAGRDRCGAPHDVAERREVVGLEVRVIGHGQRNGGDRHLERHAIFLDAAELLVEVEAAVQPDGRAGRGRGEQVQEPEDVRRRRRHLEAVLGAEPQRADPVGGAEVDRPVRVPHRLGPVGRPRAEDEHGVVVRPERDRRGWRVARAVDHGGRGRVVEIEHGVLTELLRQQGGPRPVGHAEAGCR